MKSNAATYMHNVILTNSFWCIFIIPPLWRKSRCSSTANHMSDSLRIKAKRKINANYYHAFSWLIEMMNQIKVIPTKQVSIMDWLSTLKSLPQIRMDLNHPPSLCLLWIPVIFKNSIYWAKKLFLQKLLKPNKS
jgi:hypothetical protein